MTDFEKLDLYQILILGYNLCLRNRGGKNSRDKQEKFKLIFLTFLYQRMHF